MTELSLHPAPGNREEAKLPLILLACLAPILILTCIFTPEGRLNWLMEVAAGLAGIIALAIAFRWFAFSRFVYAIIPIHVLILTYGGYYSYAKAPLGFWAMETFGLHRNHYDRIGHLALGFFPVFIIREVLVRTTPLRPSGWLNFLSVCVAFAIAAFWELVEWWSALLLDPAGGDKFLGSQGDIWDAQWDMFLGLCGAILGLALLSRVHWKSVRALMDRTGQRKGAMSSVSPPAAL